MENTQKPFNLGEVVHSLEVLIKRMNLMGGEVYLDLRPNGCFNLDETKEVFDQIIHALKIFVSLANLFDCKRINILVSRCPRADDLPRVTLSPQPEKKKDDNDYSSDALWESKWENHCDCNSLPEVPGVQWILVREWGDIPSIWQTLKKD